MVKRKLLTICLLLGLPIFTVAQTQQGYVKTKGRMMNGKYYAGKRISEATVQIKDRSAVKSRADGTFSFPVLGKSYSIQLVQKKGYVLLDQDVLYKQYSYSSNPLEIVMEDKVQLEADRRALERQVRRITDEELRRRGEEIETLKEQNKISEEKYRELLNKHNSDCDKNDQLIKDMVDRYNKTDFDQVDEFDRRVNDCIINGRLDEADSLLRTKGNVDKLIEQLNKHHAANEQARFSLGLSEAAEDHERQNVANICYNKFQIYKMRHMNDSAVHYLYQRASLDTTNIEWLIEEGNFIEQYIANYNKALNIYLKALSIAESNSQKSEYIPILLSNIGGTYSRMGDDTKALDYHRRSLKIRESRYGKNSNEVAICYNNIGFSLASLGHYTEALEYLSKSLSIRERNLGKNHIDVANSCNNIASVYSDISEYEKALKYHNRALTILQNTPNIEEFEIARIYNNIGSDYQKLGNHEKSLEYYRKAQKIDEKVLPNNHPYLATIYNNIAIVENFMGYYDSAIFYNSKAIEIKEQFLGERHPLLAVSYTNLGITYSHKEEPNEAIYYLNKALSIDTLIYGDSHPDIALIYHSLGKIYAEYGIFDRGMDYMNKALSIRKSYFGNDHILIADSYTGIASACYYNKHYGKAMDYFQKVLSIQLKKLSPNHPDIATTYNNIGSVADKLGNYKESLEYHKKALEIWNIVNSPAKVASAYNNIGTTYYNMGEYQNAIDKYRKALKIRIKILGENNLTVAQTYNNLGNVYADNKQLKQSLDCLKKAYSIQKEILKEEDSQLDILRHNMGVVEQQIIEKDVKEMRHYIYTATVVDGDTPAKEKGMEGEYIVLEYCGWTIDSTFSLFDRTAEVRGKPKEITVMKDGIITKYQFNNVIGVNFALKKVGIKEKDKIKSDYYQWLKQQ